MSATSIVLLTESLCQMPTGCKVHFEIESHAIEDVRLNLVPCGKVNKGAYGKRKKGDVSDS